MTFVPREKEREKEMSKDNSLTQALLANSRTIVRAKYKQPELPKFAVNPNLEALPYIK